ncbi:hypothetical protein HYU22_03515 [Candidatus Woesearchaeota archaeon]|nr:hypothetical protein [Candidatus Woesearchaeota archaeon]
MALKRVFPLGMMLFIFLIVGISLVSATTLKGTIYTAELDPAVNVLVEITTIPEQRFLSRDGAYSFEVPPGNYTLTALKGDISISDEVKIVNEGEFVYDLFLIPNLEDEEDLLNDTQQSLFEEEKSFLWQYLVAGVIVLLLLYRFWRARKKYGPLKPFRKRIKEESAKSMEQHKEELAKEPGYVEKALEIIRAHDGRISQKELRKEMLYLSEAKVSLIITELEHKGRIEKVKKGRGNVIILR